MIRNPLEQFQIIDLLSVSILDSYKISLTNVGLYVIIATISALAIFLIGDSKKQILWNNTTLAREAVYEGIKSLIKDQIGGENEKYLPFILSLFLFILFSNLLGMIPYSFTATSQIALALSLSVAILIGVTILGLILHGLTFFSLFVPVGTPLALVPLLVSIELISYLARAVSLGIRLAANVIAGHILLKILSTFIYSAMKSSIIFFIIAIIPAIIFTALVGLELCIAFLQAIVFIILTCSYIRDAIYLH